MALINIFSISIYNKIDEIHSKNMGLKYIMNLPSLVIRVYLGPLSSAFQSFEFH